MTTIVGHIRENTIDDSLLPASKFTASGMPNELSGAGTANLFENFNQDRTITRVDANHISLSDYSSEDSQIWWVADEVSAAWFVRRFLRCISSWHDLFAVGSEFHFALGDIDSESVFDIHFKFLGHSPDDDLTNLQNNGESFLYQQTAFNNPEVTLQ